MELAILAGLGLAGYYLSENESDKKSPLPSPTGSPDVPRIYNQNRTREVNKKVLNSSKDFFIKSQNPEKTNIIPDYFNQLGPLFKKKNNSSRLTDIDIQYNAQEDLDDVYVDMPFMRTSNVKDMNSIFKSPVFDRDHTFLKDEYEIFKFKTQNPPIKLPGVANRGVRGTGRPMGGPPHIKSEAQIEVIEDFQNVPDKDLLAMSEKLTDNADSIRKILTEDVSGKAPQCERKTTPMDLKRSKRLIGVTPDYKSILVDDEIAKYPSPFPSDKKQSGKNFSYPNFAPLQGRTQPPAEYPSFLAQFEPQTFDADGLPGAPNDIYQTNDKAKLALLERNLAFKGGWSPYQQDGSMSYGIVPDNELTHDNMMPFFSTKRGYGTNDMLNTGVFRRKNELFTGNLLDTWHKKEEIRPLFDPVKDLTYIYGTPVRPEGEESRYITSLNRQNERLFDPMRVTPGLNLKHDEIGTQGYQDMYRALPRTIDELRPKNNPRVTYEGRIIPGLKGTARPIQAPVVSYRPDGFKITTELDYLPKSDVNDGPRVRENFDLQETNRSTQHIEYTGGAFSKQEALDRNIPEEMREKYRYANKQNFTLPKPLQKYAKEETIYNPNIGSYDIEYTMRDVTGNNKYMGPTVDATSGGKVYANQQDVARETLRQITSAIPQKPGIMAPNTMRGTTHPMDIAKPTIKELTASEMLNPNAPMLNTKQRVYNTDIARTTTKETECDAIAPMNVVQSDKIYANWTDNPRITMKEIITEVPQTLTQILPFGQQQGRAPLQDILRTTMKESTVQIPYQTNVAPVNQQQGQRHPQDLPRTTMKEGTAQIQRETFVTPINQQQGQRRPQDLPRTTLKEGTVQIPYQTNMTPINQQQGQRHPQDLPRTTLKEGTVQIPYQTNMTPVNQQQGQRHPQDILRNTLKEITSQIPYQTNMTPVNQQQGQRHPQDILRNTLKEITSQIPYQTNMTPVNQQQGQRHPQDLPRTTMKEGTVQIPYNTFIRGSEYAGKVPLQDVVRTTLKEGTVQNPAQTFVQGVGQQQARAPLQDTMKTTIKEGTVQIPYNTFIQGVGQQQGKTPLQDGVRATIRETTTHNDHINGPLSEFRGYGYMAENPEARTTIRETTGQNDYVAPVQGDIQARSYNDAYNAKITDKKEVAQQYRQFTPVGATIGPKKEMIHGHLRDDNNPMHGLMPVYSVNNNLDRPLSEMSNFYKDQVPVDLYVDPKILKQLDDNPFNIPYYGRRYA